ncbi:zinc finger protein 586-like isoform X1 [Cyprinodon tularosa]|uniref:zinc finger protein 586-like isoform X1 n=1 Tax=Cyprinodon tularosa TaxID=77115 RepID=UPI0018E1E727|nr:zinc finger protein 586-like isoform X1 [Cyprinodon tularosa]XP_038161068.1 zinc finger protein 586-like isoform X1 [Cyprinodon tularosa]XP_038161069.1 zinc finger protein 586-like isoform X1 [Cyprinodon tularosa]
MSDHLMRGVQVQLTTAMDNVLRTTVFEVMRIFESAFHDHKMELVQKGEEIAQLKVKLQTAELRIKDFEVHNKRGAEKSKTQTEPEVVSDVPEQFTVVPEVDAEVPDDWCAPLCDDTATKPEEGFCPSVRLRQFSIPLYPVPLLKYEHLYSVRHGARVNLGKQVDMGAITLGRNLGTRRSTRSSTRKEKEKPYQDKDLAVCHQSNRPPKLSGDLKRLFQGLNTNYSNLKSLGRLRKRKSEGSFGDEEQKEKKEKEDLSEQKNEEKPKESEPSESKAAILQAVRMQSKEAFSCGRCKKSYPTKPGLLVHLHAQVSCGGCNMVFCFQEALDYHIRFCEKHKALMNRNHKEDEKMVTGEGNVLNSSKLIIKEERPNSSAVKSNTSREEYSCKHCVFKTKNTGKWRKHMKIHGGRMITCRLCSRKFSRKPSLKAHITRMHSQRTDPDDKRGDLGWTKPLEDVDEDKN